MKNTRKSEDAKLYRTRKQAKSAIEVFVDFCRFLALLLLGVIWPIGSGTVAQVKAPSLPAEVGHNTDQIEFVIDTTIGERKIPDEDAILRDFEEIFNNHFQTHYVNKQLSARRAVHAKSHGCLNAKFEVIDHQDEQLAHSIFDIPASYDAIIRFSNGDGPAGADTNRIVSVGIGIKVMGVTADKLLDSQTEDTADFLLINQPKFIVSDVRGFKTVIEAREAGGLKMGIALFKHPVGIFQRRWAFPEANPLDLHFWSVLPFQLDDTTVKYLLRPDERVPDGSAGPLTEDGRALMIKERIASESASFGFYMQKRLLDGSEEENMPVEDATVVWDEDDSRPIHVAQITIPKQEVGTLDANDYCERLVFSPWNTTDDFRPLGSLNRARRVVYELSARKRHSINQWSR